MEELININNPNQFWSTLKDMSANQVNSRHTSVPVDKLYCYFQCLHSKPETDRYSAELENMIKDFEEKEVSKPTVNQLDEPVTKSEFRKAVKSLKTKKQRALFVSVMKC